MYFYPRALTLMDEFGVDWHDAVDFIRAKNKSKKQDGIVSYVEIGPTFLCDTWPDRRDPMSVTAYSNGGAYSLSNLGMGMTSFVDPFGPDTPANQYALNMLIGCFHESVDSIRATHQTNLRNVPAVMNAEVESFAQRNPAYHQSWLQRLGAKISAVHQIYWNKNNEQTNARGRANSAFGDNSQQNFSDYMDRMERYNPKSGERSPFQVWHDSVVEYHNVILLERAKEYLAQQLREFEHSYNVENANVQQQLAIAEQQRLQAEREAQRIAEELRLAAQQQAEREAQEQQRIAAEQEAQRVAEAAAKAESDAAAESANSVPVSNLKVHGTFGPASFGRVGAASAVANAGQFSAAAARAMSALRGAVESFLQSSRQFGIEAASQVAKVFSSLLIPSTLANSDFFSASVPAADVLPDNGHDLTNIAAGEGEVALPGWGALLEGADLSSLVQLEPSVIEAAALVQVREAVYVAETNVYSVTLPNNPSVILTWTPIAIPESSSTALPAQPAVDQTYTGSAPSPVEIELPSTPVAPPSLHGLITVFPADSGIAPIFTVYSTPYEDANTTGEHSGRNYNPEKAGGPIQDLSWQDTTITQAGIDLVKLHTGRLDHSAANDVMIDRLEKILAGELAITDTDKRYYTHEIRELERYREIGMQDGPVPEEVKKLVWNNAHTATLEDYKLGSSDALLYVPDAMNALHKQEQEYYNSLIKGRG